MIFIVSDLHLGKHPHRDEESLRDLTACVSAIDPETIVFLGDVFDAFIESSADLPAPVIAWAERVRAWQDEGRSVQYLMGNHDRWHRIFVRDLIGEEPIRAGRDGSWGELRIHMEHGDRAQPHKTLTRFARWLSDQPLIYRLYTLVLPFGWSHAVAAAVSRRFASFAPDPRTVSALKNHARRISKEQGFDGVIMGHCHQAGLFRFQHGSWYLNTGDWYESRTFVCLGEQGARLCAWQAGGISELATTVTQEVSHPEPLEGA